MTVGIAAIQRKGSRFLFSQELKRVTAIRRVPEGTMKVIYKILGLYEECVCVPAFVCRVCKMCVCVFVYLFSAIDSMFGGYVSRGE